MLEDENIVWNKYTYFRFSQRDVFLIRSNSAAAAKQVWTRGEFCFYARICIIEWFRRIFKITAASDKYFHKSVIGDCRSGIYFYGEGSNGYEHAMQIGANSPNLCRYIFHMFTNKYLDSTLINKKKTFPFFVFAKQSYNIFLIIENNRLKFYGCNRNFYNSQLNEIIFGARRNRNILNRSAQ